MAPRASKERRHCGFTYGSRSTDRPILDEEVDALLADRLPAADHRLWWDAEHVLLGVSPREKHSMRANGTP